MSAIAIIYVAALILIAALFPWALKTYINSIAESFPKECPACDIEGPLEYDGIFYGYDQLNFHRSAHRLGRELIKPIQNLIHNGGKPRFCRCGCMPRVVV